ncbi:Glyoxylase, beta-lactamase superfamily II [Actinopolyspora xinjiangensis]|uniref:Glyoxylase, beta-lactamase superfamily II n=1 Tax=Actinopolyspora xinjiangensis TaxID=405564 RepID=A0A1H0VMF4_9ACTN|nr:MBL fold metallo-hydrolase [Actinopolyspora xinjiangensis]SDP79385.1 Glyoxylase, beta-lactamase superfamily II [Actinopolyspora xinjiangensis]
MTIDRWNVPGRMRSLRVGDHTVTYIPDGHVELSPRSWFPESTAGDWEGDRTRLLTAEGFFLGSVGGLLVEYGERALLIDAGFGPHRAAAAHTHPYLGALAGGGLLRGLRDAGRRPEEVEAVAFTHLHDDHFGWVFRPGNTSTPFLPHANLIASSEEWSSMRRRGMPVSFPYREAGDGEEIFPGVVAWSTPGHTPGHTSYVVSSGGQRLIAFGDVFHSPVQVERPEWEVSMDSDPNVGIATRDLVLKELSQPETLGFGNHFADVVFGRVVSSGAGSHWRPEHR